MINRTELIAYLNTEIENLTQVRNILAGGKIATSLVSGNKPSTSGNEPSKSRGKRRMSAAARKRISDAQKARWAKRKKKS